MQYIFIQIQYRKPQRSIDHPANSPRFKFSRFAVHEEEAVFRRVYSTVYDPVGGLHVNVSFQLGRGNVSGCRPDLLARSDLNSSRYNEITALSSSLARRWPRHTVLPTKRKKMASSEKVRDYSKSGAKTFTYLHPNRRRKMVLWTLIVQDPIARDRGIEWR